MSQTNTTQLPRRTPQAEAHTAAVVPMENIVAMEGAFHEVRLSGRPPLQDETTVHHTYQIDGAELVARYVLPHTKAHPGLTDTQVRLREADHTLFVWRTVGGRHAAPEYVLTSFEAIARTAESRDRTLFGHSDPEIIRLTESQPPVVIGQGKGAWLPRAVRRDARHAPFKAISDKQALLDLQGGTVTLRNTGYEFGELSVMEVGDILDADAHFKRMAAHLREQDRLLRASGALASMPVTKKPDVHQIVHTEPKTADFSPLASVVAAVRDRQDRSRARSSR